MELASTMTSSAIVATTTNASSSSWLWSVVEYTGSAFNNAGQRVKRFACRHKKALIVSAIIGGASLVVYGVYVSQTDKYQKQRRSRIRLQEYFERSQNTCDTTLLTMMPTLINQLDEFIDIPSPEQLRNSRSLSQAEKLALWDSCKVLTFTKLIAAIYGVVALTLMLRVQVNVVARYLFLESLIKQDHGTTEVPEQVVLTPEVQRKYLSYSEYCIKAGLWGLSGKVREVVDSVLKGYPLQQKCDLEDLNTIFDHVRRVMEEPIYGRHKNEAILNTFLLPPEKAERETLLNLGEKGSKESTTHESTPLEEKKFQMLLNETRDILESSRFNHILKKCTTVAFFSLMRSLLEAFQAKAVLSPSDEGGDAKLVMPMANLLPQVKKQLDVVLNPQVNPFLDALTLNEELKGYSFDILTSFEEL